MNPSFKTLDNVDLDIDCFSRCANQHCILISSWWSSEPTWTSFITLLDFLDFYSKKSNNVMLVQCISRSMYQLTHVKQNAEQEELNSNRITQQKIKTLPYIYPLLLLFLLLFQADQ